jgi:hypothetical protein
MISMLRRVAFLSLCAGLFVTGLDAVNLPRPASEVAISMPNGGQELLSKYHGKIVILAFILST